MLKKLINVLKRHKCHFVKHYDHKGRRYVNRCTICDKVEERQKPYKVLGGCVRINKDGSSVVYFE